MSLSPEARKLVKKYPDLVKRLRQEHLLELQLREFTKWQAGLPAKYVEPSEREHESPEERKLKESTKWAAGISSRLNESANIEKDEPKKVCGTCEYFLEADYGTGSCGLDENPTTSDHEACERWERAVSIGKSKESAGDVRSLVESVHERMKTLMSMC